MSIKKRISLFLILFAFVFTLGGEVILSAFAVRARADSVTYSNVLDDLKKDSSFNPDDYPVDESDYSLKLIQLAESESGDILLYVYKPASNSNIVASRVNMSDTGTAVGLRNCDLTLLDSSGVFQKYRVEGLKRNNEFVRKYFIVSIYRPWNADYGDTTSEGSIGVSKACPVETVWTASTSTDGHVTYSASYSDDVIKAVSSCAGEIYYSNGFIFDTVGVESFYYAFSTNKPIDSLLEAYVEYGYYYEYIDKSGLIPIEETSEGTRSVVLTSEEVFEVPDGDRNIFTEDYVYKRIQSTSAFLKNEGTTILEASKKEIAEEQWILRFAENSYFYQSYPYKVINTDITSISLFRIKYEYKDNIYDVGVVADVITGDNVIDGYGEPRDWREWLEKILMVVAIILIVVLIMFLGGPIKAVFDIIFTGLKVIINIFLLPFKIILSFFRKK